MDTSLIQTIALIPRLLVLAGVVIALAFAISRRRTLGRAATLALSGFSILVVSAVYDIVTVLLTSFGYFHHSLLPMGDYVAILSLINSVSALLWAAAMALVIVAVFVGRGKLSQAPDPACPPAGRQP